MANQKNFSATKMVIPCRISFANIWEPKAINGGDEKYSVSCLIPKSDKKTIARIQKAVEAAKEDGKTRKWGRQDPAQFKAPAPGRLISTARMMKTMRIAFSSMLPVRTRPRWWTARSIRSWIQ